MQYNPYVWKQKYGSFAHVNRPTVVMRTLNDKCWS